MTTYSSTLASAPANERTRYGTLSILGVDLYRVSTAPQFKLGQIGFGTVDDLYIYVTAGDAVAANGRANVSTSTFVTTANAGGSLQALTAFATGDYGWMRQNAKAIV